MVYFVENHSKSLELIRKNILKLKIVEPYKILHQDVLQFLANNNKTSANFEMVDLILIDPPFTQALSDQVLTLLTKCHFITPETLIAIESAKKERLEKQYSDLIQIDQRVFGDKLLSFFRKNFDKK